MIDRNYHGKFLPSGETLLFRAKNRELESRLLNFSLLTRQAS